VIRYIEVDGDGIIHAQYPEGTRARWDHSIPPYKGKGFRIIDLKVLCEQDRLYWLTKMGATP
jgi:hypothetical protein